MANHNEVGKKGEQIAIDFLTKKGYSILETNWRYKKSEIDIIVKKENNLIFVEVKTRSSNFIQEPEESVTLKKQKLIILAASRYVIKNNCDLNIRFDIISIILNKKQTIINHIKEAFYPLI